MKKLAFLLVTIMALIALFGCNGEGGAGARYTELKPYARFMTNAGNEKAELSTGFEAVGDDLLYYSYEITPGQKLVAPTTDPKRSGYLFVGWAKDRDGNEMWDFNATAEGGVTLFAKWERDESAREEEYVEPKLAFEEKKDESVPFAIKGVLSSKVVAGGVELTTLGKRLLSEHADDVKELLDYTVDSATSIKSATFNNNVITITTQGAAGEATTEVYVSDVTASLNVGNATYENKAVKYENNAAIAPYSVVMAGSSSMENWSTSVADMAPVTTVNVGIGGTTVEQWSEKLCKRLIYPFNPRAVIFYVGINNIINSKKTGSETGAALVTLFDEVHENLPNTHVYFIMINYVPGYTSYYKHIEVANAAVTAYAANKNYMTLIDAGAGLIKKSGKTNVAYFLTDGLHMSLCGYVVWGNAVKTAFIEKEKELYSL